MTRQIGFVGPGATGAALARDLAAAGTTVHRYDVRAEAVERPVAAGAVDIAAAAEERGG